MNTKMTKFLMTALLALGVSGAWAASDEVSVKIGETVTLSSFPDAFKGTTEGTEITFLKAVDVGSYGYASDVGKAIDLNGQTYSTISTVPFNCSGGVWIFKDSQGGDGINLSKAGTKLIQVQNAKVTVESGRYSVGADNNSFLFAATLPKKVNYKRDIEVVIVGGTFVGKLITIDDSRLYTYGEGEVDVDKFVQISGGTFSVEPDDKWIVSGYKKVQDAGTGYWSVVPNVTAVAQIGETKYETLQAALTAAKSGETIKLLADLENIGTVALKDGVTFDGDGKKITGASALYCCSTGASVIKNVVFENIHNDSPISEENRELYGFPEGAIGTQSAIYAEGFASGSITITGCTFDNCDWDAIQIVPTGKSKGTISITDNIFKHTDDTKRQLRHIHIQCTDSVMPKLVVTATDNQLFDCEKGVVAFCVAGYMKGADSNYSGNYISDVSMVECAATYDIKLGDFYPMRSQPTVDVDDIDVLAMFDNVVYYSADDLVAAINSSSTAYPYLYLYGDVSSKSAVVIDNSRITKLYWYGGSTEATGGHQFAAPSITFNVPVYTAYNPCFQIEGAFVANKKFQARSGTYSADSFSGTLEVTGGTYNKDVSAYVNENKSLVKDNGNGTWTVEDYTDQTAVADGKPFKTSTAGYFSTLQAALNVSTTVDALVDVNENVNCGSNNDVINLRNMVSYTGSLVGQKKITLCPYATYTTANEINLTSVTCPTFVIGSGKKWLRNVTIGGGKIGRFEISSTCTVTTLSGNTEIDEIVLTTYYYTVSHYAKATLTITGGTYGTIKCRVNATAAETPLPNDALDLTITGGTFGFDPTDYVADGYEVVVQGTTPETWKVVRPTPPEVEVTVPETIPVKDAEGNTVSGEAEAAAGEVVAQVKQDIASNKIPAQHTGTGVTLIENTSAIVAALQTQADAFDARAQVTEESSINKYVDVEVKETKVNVSGATATFASIVFNVTPKAEITIVSAKEGSAGEEKTLTTTVANADITEPITFRLPLPNYFTVSAIVKHEGDPDRLLPVKGAEGGKYVEVTVTHFSEFEVEPSDEVSTTVGSSTVLGIKRRADVAAGTVAVAVPWLGTDGNAIAVQNLIAKDCLKVNDELHVWNGTGYDAWKWSGSEWEPFTSSTGVTSPTTASLVRGKAAWLKRAAAGSIIQIGQYNEGTISTAVTKGHNLLINPKSEATPFTKIPGTVGDQISVISAAGKKIRYEYNGTQWGYKTVGLDADGLTTVTWKPATEIPADTGFWYIGVKGTPTIQW